MDRVGWGGRDQLTHLEHGHGDRNAPAEGGRRLAAPRHRVHLAHFLRPRHHQQQRNAVVELDQTVPEHSGAQQLVRVQVKVLDQLKGCPRGQQDRESRDHSRLQWVPGNKFILSQSQVSRDQFPIDCSQIFQWAPPPLSHSSPLSPDHSPSVPPSPVGHGIGAVPAWPCPRLPLPGLPPLPPLPSDGPIPRG